MADCRHKLAPVLPSNKQHQLRQTKRLLSQRQAPLSQAKVQLSQTNRLVSQTNGQLCQAKGRLCQLRRLVSQTGGLLCQAKTAAESDRRAAESDKREAKNREAEAEAMAAIAAAANRWSSNTGLNYSLWCRRADQATHVDSSCSVGPFRQCSAPNSATLSPHQLLYAGQTGCTQLLQNSRHTLPHCST